jgi:hypothetical protein
MNPSSPHGLPQKVDVMQVLMPGVVEATWQPLRGRCFLLGVVADGPYSNLGYRSLAMPIGALTDPFSYEDEFICSPQTMDSSPSQVCIIALIMRGPDGTWTDFRAIPIRFATIKTSRESRFGGRTWTLELRNTMLYCSPNCMSMQGQRVASLLDAPADVNRDSLLEERGLAARHPYLASKVESGLISTVMGCPHCHTLRRRSPIVSTIDEDDADVWNQFMRQFGTVVMSEKLEPGPGFTQSFLRVVGITQLRKDINRCEDRIEYLPMEPAKVGEAFINQVILRRRREYTMLIRGRRGNLPFPLKTSVIRASLSAPEMLAVVENREIEISKGTIEHELRIYTRDKHGQANIVVAVTPEQNGYRQAGRFELEIPIDIGGRARWTRIVGAVFVAAGLGFEVLTVIFRQGQHFFGVGGPEAGAFGLVVAAAGAGLLSLQHSD